MAEILMRSCGCLLIVAAGMVLRRSRFYHPSVPRFLSRLIIYLTLPCSLISAYQTGTFEGSSFSITLCAMAACLTADLLAFWMYSRNKPAVQSAAMISASGFDIMVFAAPLILSLYPETALRVILFFELGNLAMNLGATYTVSRLSLSGHPKITFTRILQVLLSSVPFDVCIVLTILSATGFEMPEAVSEIASFAGDANAFLCLLLAGMLLRIPVRKQILSRSGSILLGHYAISAILALFVYFLLPVDQASREVVVLCLMAPCALSGPALLESMGIRTALDATVYTCSLPVGMILMTIIGLLFA